MHARSRRSRAWTTLALCAPLLAWIAAPAAPAAANPKYAGMVYDVIGEKTLYADDADEKRYPASLTKIMTIYIIFEELTAGNITLDTRFTVSRYAAARPPSKIGFKPGGTIKVRDAILALVTKSANDVAAAVAENIAGSERRFAERMTKTARRIGMSDTTFRNASGLPNAKQVTTARDMVRLGVAIQRDFPHYYGVFETQSFEFRDRRYRNHNRLLGRVAGVDGIKTGYIRASGFNLVSSVRRDGRHIVAVVMGGRTGASRNRHMQDLIARHLPKAKRGTPMVFAEWTGDGPPPVPRPKPDLTPLFASRLVAQTRAEDPIGQKVLAFASQTRAAAAPRSGPPRSASDAIEAVIADTDDAAPSGLTVVAAPATDVPRAVGAAAAPSLRASAAPRPPRDPRLDEAFAAVDDARLDSAALVAAIARARLEGLVPARGGSPTAARDGWQIQLGAVPSRDRARTILREAVETVPALRQHEMVTLPVTTESGTLYRARIAGFASRDAAQEACQRFANHNRPCWAVSM